MSNAKKVTSYEAIRYNSIRHSAVAWRRKSSYRKKMKREISKRLRNYLKKHLNVHNI